MVHNAHYTVGNYLSIRRRINAYRHFYSYISKFVVKLKYFNFKIKKITYGFSNEQENVKFLYELLHQNTSGRLGLGVR